MFRQIIVNFGVRIVAAVLSFLIIVLLSQALGAEGKGICTRYVVVISNALIFCDLLGGPPLVYLSSRYKITNMLFPSYLWSAATSCIVICVFIALKQIDQKEFVQLAGLSFLNSCIAINQNILSGRQHFGKLNVIIFFQSVLAFAGLKVLFVLSAATTENYLYSLYIAWAFSASLGLFFIFSIRDTAPKISFPEFFTQAIKYGFINAAGHIIQFFNQRLSYFFLNEKSLGIFSNAVSLGESVWMVSNSIATVQYGKVSNTTDKSKAEKISFVLLKINLLL
ncbi:MAG: hypothetical protein IAF38_02555, partial [Bacteroidia bacterium]|nr:hypothetical protein [Bacteroidia bacterium]